MPSSTPGFAVADRLDVVAIWIEHERTVVAVRVLGPESRSPVVTSSRCDGRRVEGVDLFPPVCGEGDVHGGSGRVGRGYREIVCLFEAKLDLLGSLAPRSDLTEAEGQKGMDVELSAPGEIAHADGEM